MKHVIHPHTGRSARAFAMALLLVPQLAAAWRRLHDTGRNGAWYFIGLIPLVGWIIVIYWLCLPGDPDMNRFGPDPREGGFEG